MPIWKVMHCFPSHQPHCQLSCLPFRFFPKCWVLWGVEKGVDPPHKYRNNHKQQPRQLSTFWPIRWQGYLSSICSHYQLQRSSFSTKKHLQREEGKCSIFSGMFFAGWTDAESLSNNQFSSRTPWLRREALKEAFPVKLLWVNSFRWILLIMFVILDIFLWISLVILADSTTIRKSHRPRLTHTKNGKNCNYAQTFQIIRDQSSLTYDYIERNLDGDDKNPN